MTGAEAVLRTAAAAGIEGCFANPGTTEMPLANALANLHNARRARSPVVNLVGDQATWHRDADAPLTSDIVSLAKPMSRWVRQTRETARIAQDAAEAIAAAQEGPGGVATLIL